MAKYKAFNVHDLYPEGYVFPWSTFEADPEGYQFTSDDIAYLNARELEEYELKVPMTPYEKRALRKWVASGHSVRENPGSKYLPDLMYPPPDFLDVYRTDRELDRELKGKTDEEIRAYLMDYMGWSDEPEDPQEELPEYISGEELPFQHVQPSLSPSASSSGSLTQDDTMMRRQNFYLWMFISQEGLFEEAKEFLAENMDEPTPFESGK